MIKILTTGGTIDKIYFDATSEYEIGEPTIPHIFQEVGVHAEYDLEPLMRKDSLELTDVDREHISERCGNSRFNKILITHGTDTMCETAEHLVRAGGIEGKTIVLTGALSPARFRVTDAVFNLGLAMGAVQSMPAGVYIAMSGEVFSAGNVRKNREMGRFEVIG
ncbi:MAG: asparaginase domain-containing protein [Akkermansiaceae bacterium]